MAAKLDVSDESVRALLDEPSRKSVPDTVVEANIERSLRIVTDVQDPDAKKTRVEDAIRAVAVWLTYGSYMEGITEQLGAISVADQTKLDHYRKVAEWFLNHVSRSPVDLDIESIQNQSLIGVPPEVSTLTTSEGFTQA